MALTAVLAGCSGAGREGGSDSPTAVENEPPVVTITQPNDGSQFAAGAMIEFDGLGSDPEDGGLPDSVLRWASSRDGSLGVGRSISARLSSGEHVVVLTGTDSRGAAAHDTISVSVLANRPPVVFISAPSEGSEFASGALVTFRGGGNDPEDGDLGGSALAWVSSRDGLLGQGDSIAATLTSGLHSVVLTGTDSEGLAAADTVTVTILRNQLPSASITSPTDGSSFSNAQPITFEGVGTDPEDGDLSGNSLQWTSSISGALGYGRSITTALPAGSHVIALTARDSEGAEASDTIAISVLDPGSDVSPPRIVSGAQSPDSVDVSAGPATVTFQVRVTDDLSGVHFVQAQWESPSGSQLVGFVGLARVSGDPFDGVYQGAATFPQHAEQGAWRLLRVGASDEAGNYKLYATGELAALGVPVSVQVNSTPDVSPPRIVSGSQSPDSVDISAGPATVTFQVRVTDDLSGVHFVQAQWEGPSGSQLVGFVELARVSGNAFDGVYQGNAVFPQYAEEGTWRLLRVGASDEAGNYKLYNTSELAALGVPVKVQVKG